MSDERIQKVMARLGLGSRREIERWIDRGSVRVNGQTIGLGQRVRPGDRIEAQGRRLTVPPQRQAEPRVLMYHKPPGEVVTRRDEAGRPTVFARLPGVHWGRWVAVGRLDLNTAGLLLLTDSGDLANALMHPRAGLEREYAVRVLGPVDPACLERMTAGIELEEGPARFARIREAGGEGRNHWYHVVLNEGRYREVRRLWASQGVTVSRLIRVRYGPISLPRDLRQGRHRELESPSRNALLETVGWAPAPPPRRSRAPRQRQRARGRR
jgi:23S rRNA pseudouridine2605 synthase